jgi:hypothetical protein
MLNANVNNFWNDIFNSIKDSKHLMVMCKVQYSEELGGSGARCSCLRPRAEQSTES